MELRQPLHPVSGLEGTALGWRVAHARRRARRHARAVSVRFVAVASRVPRGRLLVSVGVTLAVALASLWFMRPVAPGLHEATGIAAAALR